MTHFWAEVGVEVVVAALPRRDELRPAHLHIALRVLLEQRKPLGTRGLLAGFAVGLSFVALTIAALGGVRVCRTSP